MNRLEKNQIDLGYIPLLDCVAILWAQKRGFFKQQGLQVNLIKEASWASLRDRLAFGVLDAAHCLSVMLPAAHLGQDQIGIPFQSSIVLSYNCANISLSQRLCHELDISAHDSPQQSSAKLTHAISHGHPIKLSHVFPYSIHHYGLREWLALSNLPLAKRFPMLSCPPQHMVHALAAQNIDGFCVGEPWNIQAEIQGLSRIVSSSRAVIPNVADKVLAVTQTWAEQHPNLLGVITTAIQTAQEELQQLQDLTALWALLIDYNIIQFNCSHDVHTQYFYQIQHIVKNFSQNAPQPNVQDFKWMIEQMNKWGQLTEEIDDSLQIAHQCIVNI